MRVASAVLVLDYRELKEHCLNVWLYHSACRVFLLQLEGEPANGLLESDELDLVQFAEGVANSDGECAWRVALVRLEVHVD